MYWENQMERSTRSRRIPCRNLGPGMATNKRDCRDPVAMGGGKHSMGFYAISLQESILPVE
uniref:Uncharacterized protein n=1 Tax=Candidatus Kentrum sp. SD TaxID=2126332 RepID=A0A450Z1Y8_9GAMM|nr:MAG: hypothetical protein BECKSD772F_GA0070984_11074 [Candidatus Kentron sp. SD]VFK47759.1 MAG: hypothetical protein BECKSD772E_GA0070983_11054 [Candidatus Kentron sp. SD]